MVKWLRKWLYNLLFVPAAVRTVTMTKAEQEKEKAKRRFWEECKCQPKNEEGETE